ncbi:MAG: SIMPL domain-containing protein [Cyanobacteria bacterium]|nr:SIMPL domain-containing protein [Cyanobacteriota bacterium]
MTVMDSIRFQAHPPMGAPQKTNPKAPVHFGAAAAKTTLDESPFIATQGTGVVSKMPDSLAVKMNLSRQNPTQAGAVNDANTAGAALRQAIDSLGLKGLNVSSQLSVQPVWTQGTGKKPPVISAYSATVSLSATATGVSDSDLPAYAARIMEVAADNKADNVAPNFYLNDTTGAAREALALAIQDARAMAEASAKAAGIPLGDILSIEVGQNYGRVSAKGGGGARAFAASAPSMHAEVSDDAFTIAPLEIGAPQVSVRFAIGKSPKTGKKA